MFGFNVHFSKILSCTTYDTAGKIKQDVHQCWFRNPLAMSQNHVISERSPSNKGEVLKGALCTGTHEEHATWPPPKRTFRLACLLDFIPDINSLLVIYKLYCTGIYLIQLF